MIWTKGTNQRAKLQAFDCQSEIPPNLYFDRFHLLKEYKIIAKKSIEEMCLMNLKGDTKFKGKLTRDFKNGMRNLTNVYRSTRKSQNWDFDGILLSKVENL